MNAFCRKLITEWRKLKLPFSEENLVVGVSGGADSVALILALAQIKKLGKLNVNFFVAHFNHGLRGKESLEDVSFVEKLTKQLEFEFVLGEGNISKKGNLEQNARIARYQFLTTVAEKTKAYGVLTGHTLNDQAETLLLNLIRGSGVTGLSAMKIISELKQNPKVFLIRPLVSWATRQETQEFCELQEINFRKDEMNDDVNFSRVRIRKELIPILKTYNPKIIQTLAKTAFLLQENSADFDDNQQKLLSNPKIESLQSLSKSTLYRLLRKWVEDYRGNLRGLSFNHFEAIEKLIFSRKSGKIVELPNGESIEKRNGKLFFQKKG